MKTFPALYIDPNGKLRAIPECPEEPQPFPHRRGSNLNEDMVRYYQSILDYHQALAAAKQSAIEVSDLEQAKQLIERMVYERDPNAILVYQIEGYRDTVIPLPTGWKVETIWEKNIGTDFDGDPIIERKKVVILVPPKSEERVSERPDIRNFSCYNDYNKALTEWLSQDHLKPCPFCGGQAEIKQTGKSKMKIFCKGCHFGLQQRVLKLSMEWLEKTLRNSWNMRARPIDDLSIERHLVNIKNTQLELMKKEMDRLKDDLFTVADPDHPEYESIKERYK